jgi:hypothetical protein
LSTQCAKTCTHDIRHPFVVSVGNDTEQFLDTFTPDRCNDAEFGRARIALMTAVALAD